MPRTDNRRFGLAIALLAALPAIVSTAHGVAIGWTPFGDRAIIAVRAYDVLTTHSPLLGPHSSVATGAAVTRHLGPMLYWLLAVPVRLFGAGSIGVVVGLVNVLSVMGVVLVARRRGGDALMFAAAIVVAVVCASLPNEALHDVWNPFVPILPFALLLMLAWSLACGDYRLLPLTIAVASFVVQCHFTFVLPAVGVMAVALAGLATARRPAGALRPWLIAAIAVAAICWSGPLLEQAIHRPGNLVLVARTVTGNGHPIGARFGWRAVVRSVGVPPWWLRPPDANGGRLVDLLRAPSPAQSISCAIALALLLLVSVRALLRRRRAMAAAALIGLVLCVALFLDASATPGRGLLVSTLGYTMHWGSPAGAWVWTVLGSSLAIAVARRTSFAARHRLPFAYAAALAATAAAAIVSAAVRGPDEDQAKYRPAATLSAAVAKAFKPGQAVEVEGSGTYNGFDLEAATVFALRRHGVRVFSGPLAALLGGSYDPRGHRYDALVYVHDGDRAAPGARALASVKVLARSPYGSHPVVDQTVVATVAAPGAR